MATQILSANVSLINNGPHHNQHHNSSQVNPQHYQSTVELHLRSKARYVKEARDELFNNKPEEETNDGLTGKGGGGDSEIVLKEHERVQERIAQEMVLLARNLKENCMTANSIIKSDTQVRHCSFHVVIDLELILH